MYISIMHNNLGTARESQGAGPSLGLGMVDSEHPRQLEVLETKKARRQRQGHGVPGRIQHGKYYSETNKKHKTDKVKNPRFCMHLTNISVLSMRCDAILDIADTEEGTLRKEARLSEGKENGTERTRKGLWIVTRVVMGRVRSWKIMGRVCLREAFGKRERRAAGTLIRK